MSDTHDIIASFDERLKRIDMGAEWSPRRRSVTRTLIRLLVSAVVATILPFVVLVRFSSLFYLRASYPTWQALAAAAAVTVILVTVMGAWISRKLTGKARISMVGKWIALPLVTAFCGYTLLYVADANTKSGEVKTYYAAVHPILRVALSTLILAEDDLVITDAFRTPTDYARMGLPVREVSHHYRQRDGYVHAVDLRTIGHGAARNRLVEWYFRLMGFQTLRHVGTADHLHVALEER